MERADIEPTQSPDASDNDEQDALAGLTEEEARAGAPTEEEPITEEPAEEESVTDDHAQREPAKQPPAYGLVSKNESSPDHDRFRSPE